MVSIIHPEMRAHARFIGLGLFLAFCGGVLPDLISHGIILPERDGHLELAVIGAFLIASGLLWSGFSIALLRRFHHVGHGSLEMVE